MKRRNFIWYSLLFVTGCAAATSNSNSRSSIAPEKLRFAVSDTHGIEELQRDYEPFRQVLEEALETEIEFFPTKNFTTAGSALQLGQVDLIFAGSSEYVIIKARTNAFPIIGLTRPGFRSIIAVRADSGIKSVSQLKGKKIAMREVGSVSGHLGPTKMLMDAGLNPQRDLKILMLGDDGLKALSKGEVDAWGISIFRYKRSLPAEGLSVEAFPVIAEGPLYPNDIFVASSKLAPDLIQKMRDRMLKNQDKLIQALLSTKILSSKFQGSRLAPANDTDYDMVREIYKVTGEGNFIQ